MKYSTHYILKGALTNFGCKLDTHLQKIGTEERENISFPIYHFTTLDALEGILRSECLWLTRIKDLDDPTEISHVLEFSLNNIRRKARGDNRILAIFCETFLSGIHRVMSEQFRFYSASFCQHGDLAHLWKVFGDEGKGARIGFSSKAFPFASNDKVNEESMVEERGANDIFLYPISYDICDAHLKQKEATEEAFRILSSPLIRKALCYGCADGEFLKELSINLAMWILFNATSYKLPQYQMESEVRALYVENQTNLSSRMMTMNGSGKRYLEYKFDAPLRENDTVADILLGPNTSNENESRLLSILDELDYPNIEVKRSNLSRRNVESNTSLGA